MRLSIHNISIFILIFSLFSCKYSREKQFVLDIVNSPDTEKTLNKYKDLTGKYFRDSLDYNKEDFKGFVKAHLQHKDFRLKRYKWYRPYMIHFDEKDLKTKHVKFVIQNKESDIAFDFIDKKGDVYLASVGLDPDRLYDCIVRDEPPSKNIEKQSPHPRQYSIQFQPPFLYLYHDKQMLNKFFLPVNEVHNLGYKNLEETDNKLHLILEWGSFNFSHENTFVFTRNKQNLYLTRINIRIFINPEDKIQRDSILFHPPVPLEKVSLKKIYRDYIDKL